MYKFFTLLLITVHLFCKRHCIEQSYPKEGQIFMCKYKDEKNMEFYFISVYDSKKIFNISASAWYDVKRHELFQWIYEGKRIFINFQNNKTFVDFNETLFDNLEYWQ